jgi:hypothetical protein
VAAAGLTSCLVSDGADGAGHSGLVRSVTYSMRGLDELRQVVQRSPPGTCPCS